jgi:hypothetical protein
MSDLSGSDIAVHAKDAETLVVEVRNWLNSQAQLRAPGPARVWTAFLKFMSDNYTSLKDRGFSDPNIERLPVDELMTCITAWVEQTRKADRASRRR